MSDQRNDQRRDKRLSIELVASFRENKSYAKVQEASVLNINQSGLCIYSDEQIKMNHEIEISVKLDEDQEVHLLAQPVWVKMDPETRKYSTGLKVKDFSSPEAQKLKEFCDQRLLFPPNQN